MYEPTGTRMLVSCVKKEGTKSGGVFGGPNCAVNAADRPVGPGGP
jgi:hypothetical protein